MKITKNNYIWYAALFIWAVFSIIMLVYSLYNNGRSVYPLYYNVGNAWNSGKSIYAGDCSTYSYWPGFALIFAVLVKLPYQVGAVVWSAVNIGSIALALLFLGRAVFSEKNKTGVLMLLALPLIFEGIINQQSNALVAAAALTGATYIYKENLWAGTIFMLLAGVSKIAPIAFPLLFIVLYPKKLWWRYLVVLCGILMLPMLFAEPEYVLRQYNNWIALLSGEMNERWAYRDFFVLCELFSSGKMTTNLMPEFPAWYRVVQAGGAGLLCLLCLWLRYVKKYGTKSMLTAVVMSGSVWWLLLGPSTEIATCVAGVGAGGLGTVIAWKSRAGRWLMLIAYVCVAIGSNGDYEWNMRQLTTSDWIYGMLPFGASLMYLWVCLYSHKALALTTENKEVI